MKKLLPTLALCSCFIGGAVGSQTVAVDDNAEKIVASVNTTWNNTFNSGDSVALATLYYDKATLSPGNGEVLVGHEQISQLFKSFIDNGVHNHSIETIDVYREHNQIVQLGKWRAEGVNDKQEATSFGGVLVTVIEQSSDGTWLTRSHVWNMGKM
ncbi:MAG TPA: SgcJ/EcaC family oxidoreductase [Methylophaga sp.]|nr:SgcJ/EcaC family oxidoreductase [Methylophaga sp.]